MKAGLYLMRTPIAVFNQRLGFFGDMALKRTTNSYDVWRDILNPEKMMNGEALMVLLEWTIYGFSGEKELGLPASQSKTWLTDRSFGSPGLRKTNPSTYHQSSVSNGCA